MSSSDRTPSAVLYQNVDNAVFLIDIPQSVSEAQGTVDNPCTSHIYSVQPRQTPYPSVEPKSKEAEKRLRTQALSSIDLGLPPEIIHCALREIAKRRIGNWCLPRKILPYEAQAKDSRQKSAQPPCFASNSNNQGHQHLRTFKSFASVIAPQLIIPDDLKESRQFVEPLFIRPTATSKPTRLSVRDLSNRLIYNPDASPATIHCSDQCYVVPPRASFLLSKISQATAPCFSMAALTMWPSPSSNTKAGPGQFDLVLLDPPWDNRSVKRSAKYATTQDSDPMDVLKASLNQHIAPTGLVACWVTNKTKIHQRVLEMFEDWDVRHIETWVWVKTTVCGVPVTDIEGLWRKPFETLLFGRKTSDGSDQQGSEVRKRVIAAVPSFHSAKPSLKALVEPLLPREYRALEIFARNLTAGWCTWGDEVLMFNWEGYWSLPEGAFHKNGNHSSAPL
ncbi:hypothetical protein MMC21_003470 [Puttea exsequens]|nr:hypothetical protein [Puttea exsequens]